MAADKHIRSQKVGVAVQTTGWGNPVATTGTFYIQPAIAGTVNISPTVTSNQFNYYSSAGIMDSEDRKYIESVTGLKTISYDFVVERDRIAPTLAGAFLYVDEDDVTTPYNKTYKPVDSVVDFTALSDSTSDNTILHTIVVDSISGSDGVRLQDAIVESLQITADNMASGTDRLLKGSVTWIGRVLDDNQDFSGATFTALPSTSGYLDAGDCTLNITVGGNTFSSLCWRNFEFNLNNNTSPDCMTTAGKAGQYKVAPEITYSIGIPYNSSTYAVFGSFQDGDNVAFDFGDTGDELFKWDGEKGEITAPPVNTEGDYLSINLQFKALRPSGGWNSAYFTHQDDVKYYSA